MPRSGLREFGARELRVRRRLWHTPREMQPPFDILANSDAFEELCADILAAEGFADIDWRGPGPDGGRDLEATWLISDPTGGTHRSRWYVECKWYTDSVPFPEIEPKLFAATAARADYLLIATSSRVRNTAMDLVNEWLANRGQPFQVRYWTGRDLLRLAVRHPQVFAKHFPGATPPAWGDSEAKIRRLQALAASSTDRLMWRVVPSIQWITNQLLVAKELAAGATGVAPEILQELDLLACYTRAHELFSQTSLDRPADRDVNAESLLQFVGACVARRVPSLPPSIRYASICDLATSRPLLVAATFELVLNAALYSEGTAPSVDFRCDEHHWTIEVRNKSSEKLPASWPLFAYRGKTAQTRNPSGQGLGSWLAHEAGRVAGLRVWWSVESGDWVARIQGARQ